MASRTVSVILTAQVNGYLDGMQRAARATRENASEAERAAHVLETQKQAFEVGGKTAVAFGAATAAALVLAAKASAEYGAKMAELRSLSGATSATMGKLSEAAMTQGQAFGQSASQVADAEIELTKAGRSAADIMGGDLKGALALAAAGSLDVGQATQIGVTALTQFAAQGPSISHVADLLAAGSAKALGSVEDLGMALNQSGLVASQMGVSLEETTGTLSAFAQSGLLGSDAGTSFKTMLLSLQSPTDQAAALLEKYNIHAYDTQGAFVGIASLAGQLQAGMSNLSQAERDAALSTIFGTDAIRAANVLYKEGANGINDWTREVDATGYASAQAAGKMDSLQGDVTKLSSAFETGLVRAGQAADGPLRGIAQTATTLVNSFSEIPGPVLSVGVAAGTLVAGVAVLGGGFLLAVPKIAAFKEALKDLNVDAKEAAGGFAKGAALMTGITGFAGMLAAAAQTGTASAKDVARAGVLIENGWKGVNDLFGSAGGLNATTIGGSGLKATLQSLGEAGSFWSDAGGAKGFDTMTLGFSHFADVYKGNESTLDAFGQQLAGLAQQDLSGAQKSFNALTKSQKLSGDEVRLLLTHMPAYTEELAQQAAAAGVDANEHNLLSIATGRGAASVKVLKQQHEAAAEAARRQATATAVLAGKAKTAETSIDDLRDAIDGLDHGQLDAREAARGFEKAIDDAADAAKKNGKTLDIHTEKGRENQAALDGIAVAAKASAKAYLEQTHDAKGASRIIEDGKEAYIRAAHAMGLGEEKAKALADALLGIPPTVTLKLTGNAFDNLVAFERRFRALNGAAVDVSVRMGKGPLAVKGQATGGAVDGQGPKGVDSVLRMLAPGEHVLTDRDVDAMGGQGGVYAFRAALHGGVEGMARGGAVRRRSQPFGGIVDQERVAARRVQSMNELMDDFVRERRGLRALASAEARAQKAYDNTPGGKKNAAAKRSAKAALDAAKKRTADAEKAHDRTRDAYQEAKQQRDEARASAANIRLGREDFQSAERRDPNRRSNDPLAYVDQLRQMSRDGDFSPTRRKAMRDAANGVELALVKLTASSAAAKEKLDTLKQSSEQLRDSIAGAVRGSFSAGSAPLTGAREASTRAVAGAWITRNGMRFRSYSEERVEASEGRMTAGGLASYYRKGANDARTFAAGLAKLRTQGWVPDALLAEVGGYGVAQGLPIVQALLSANGAQRQQIAAGYTSIGSSATAAGKTIADDSYAKQIAAAKADADRIQDSITTEGEKLRKLIARAFGLKGYATGTSSAEGGVRWVGEEGPELIGFRGGERVLSARDSARWVSGGSYGGGSSTAPVVVQAPAFPDTITVQDLHGFQATMRVVAQQVVSARNDDIAVRVIGAV